MGYFQALAFTVVSLLFISCQPIEELNSSITSTDGLNQNQSETIVEVSEEENEEEQINSSTPNYFPLEEPLDKDLGIPKTLWATYYTLHQAAEVTSDTALRDMSSKVLAQLSRRDWCYAAMEGSVAVRKSDGTIETYNYAGTTSSHTVDCSDYFSYNLGRTKFQKAVGAYGDGVRNYKLSPYRTIAVDSSIIPYGTVLYIPQARGNEVEMPDGTIGYHDGYFFAADTGGAIHNSHIDVFIATASTNPFSWVKSNSSSTFAAYIIEDQEVIDYLKGLH